MIEGRSGATSRIRVVEDAWFGAQVQPLDCASTEATLEWKELLALREAARAIDPNAIKAALCKGVPPALRPEVWLKFSGVARRREAQPHAYAQLCERVASSGRQTMRGVIEQVEKDLRRTEAGTEGEKLDALRRVLCGFAAYEPDVGYVQGMNFIAAGLLATLDEECAFWMLVAVVQEWLPDHYSKAMVGNHVDCRVLERLTAEHLPDVAAHLKQLDASIQLICTRWFLCLWSSVLPPAVLLRVWDFLFVCGPTATMQVALACMHWIAPTLTKATDIGGVLMSVKERLAATDDGGMLLQVALYRLTDISAGQLVAWRRFCRQQVKEEARHMHATRYLLKLQRDSGFSLSEVNMIAKLCGEYTSDVSQPAGSLLSITLDFTSFLRVVRGLLPQWKNECELLDRLFAIFSTLGDDGKPGRDDGTSKQGLPQTLTVSPSSSSGASDQIARLTFAQLIHGLSWLLRGTSTSRSRLCFQCFDDSGEGRVSSARFNALLLGVYVMYEPSWPIPSSRMGCIHEEAAQFVDMMYELWDEEADGSLTESQFDRAAHQHPLLVQAFQLEQLDAPAPVLDSFSSPLGAAHLKARPGVYTGLRPGALSRFDEAYFGNVR
ncbi:hypothetical protein AB1Y20_011814 [Prymnesium parvum]|uniref:Rab-GAP TBC domain-containing protein n=1 Tax=Prymnesium parvum TaxID=97485 RepID=A0AB34IIB6_PRYPA